MRTKLDEKMMHNVRTAVKEADALLVILDATEDAAAALAMVNLGPDWRGPPVALVRGLLLSCVSRPATVESLAKQLVFHRRQGFYEVTVRSTWAPTGAGRQ